MTRYIVRSARLTLALCGGVAVLASCTETPSTGPISHSATLLLTTSNLQSLDSTGQVIVAANPGDPTLKALVDSTLQVLMAGVSAARVDVTTDLTTKPLYFVGVHRTVARSTGSWSTWGIVGLDDPSHLENLIEVSGFAQNSTATPPMSVSGTIGDGLGFVNALMLQVASGGAVTQWYAGSGTVSITSSAPGAACPGFTPTSVVVCNLETITLHFSASATGGSNGAGARSASQPTDVQIPSIRLTYTPPSPNGARGTATVR